MVAPTADLIPAAADSARAVAHIYTVSLSTLVPLTVAGVAALVLRHSQAAARVAVWRASVIAVLVVYVGALLPIGRVAWVVPAGLASPLVMLGRIGVQGAKDVDATREGLAIQLAVIAYLVGVLAVLAPICIATIRLSLRTRRAAEPDERLRRALADARLTSGVHRRVTLRVSRDASVPLTWGVARSTILLPAHAIRESDARLRTILLHELSHIRSNDAFYLMSSRVACALLWFHPAAWWLDRRLRADCELACDDRVLATGVRQSDYAELLADSCDRLHERRPPLALAICERAGLRERLDSILDSSRGGRRASRRTAIVAAGLVLAAAGPASLVHLAPTRAVLDALMRDQRWESRAYAVLGLAQRPDSLEIARSAATSDPDPNVRAWARYAVSLDPISPPALIAPRIR